MPKNFEELPVWQKSRELVNYIYSLTRKDVFNRDFSLVDQIRRASASVMSNIAEGFERGSNAEFIQFLYISKGSAGEVRTQLYIAFDQGYISKEEFKIGFDLCRDVAGQLSGLIDYLKGSNLKGEKFNIKRKTWAEEVEEITKQFNIQNSKFKKE
ncbi:MAG: four helix bundle protein [Thermodesulfovibrionales bacterium]|nr:four helix bundle protein [Thermodesulfovibrionales bacterium]